MFRLSSIGLTVVGFCACVALAIADHAPQPPCYGLGQSNCADCLSLEMVTDCDDCSCASAPGS